MTNAVGNMTNKRGNRQGAYLNPFKAAVFDIETSALEAVGAGTLLLACVKPLGGKAKVLRADELRCKPGREVRLVYELLRELSQYQLLIGHNILNFDWPYIKSRAVILGVPVPYPPPLFYDTKPAFKRSGLRTVDNGHGKPTAALAMIVDFLGYEQEKTALYPRHHWECVWGDKAGRLKAMNDLASHCVKDTNMTEEIYYKLFALDPNPIIRRLR